MRNPAESSLCIVFGDTLVAEVEHELTCLLGTAPRHSGRPVGNVWSYGPFERGAAPAAAP